jgi:hypothetical protein
MFISFILKEEAIRMIIGEVLDALFFDEKEKKMVAGKSSILLETSKDGMPHFQGYVLIMCA